MVRYTQNKIMMPCGKASIFVYEEEGNSDKRFISLVQIVRYCAGLAYEAAETFVIIYTDDLTVKYNNGAITAYLLEITEDNFTALAERLKEKQTGKELLPKLAEVYDMVKRYEMPSKTCWRPESVNRVKEERKTQSRTPPPEFVRPPVETPVEVELKVRGVNKEHHYENRQIKAAEQVPANVEPNVVQVEQSEVTLNVTHVVHTPIDKVEVSIPIEQPAVKVDPMAIVVPEVREKKRIGRPPKVTTTQEILHKTPSVNELETLIGDTLGFPVQTYEYRLGKTVRGITMFIDTKSKIVAFDLISLLRTLECERSPDAFTYELRDKMVVQGLDKSYKAVVVHFEHFAYTCDLIRFSVSKSGTVFKKALKLSSLSENEVILKEAAEFHEVSKEELNLTMGYLMDAVVELGKGLKSDEDRIVLTKKDVKHTVKRLINKLRDSIGGED